MLIRFKNNNTRFTLHTELQMRNKYYYIRV